MRIESVEAMLCLRAALALLTLVEGVYASVSTSEVEMQEETEMMSMKQELLQYGVRHVKAGEEYHAANLLAVEEELEEEALARQLQGEADSVSMQQILQHRYQLLSNPTWEGEGSQVDCHKYPMFCDKKLNCAEDPLTPAEKSAMDSQIALRGKANIRSWCRAYPMYSTSVQRCIVEENPRGYAQEMFQAQKNLKLTSADAMYCFMAGHCNNTEVTEATTQTEASAICDKLYGQRWTKIGWNDFMGVLARALELSTTHHVPKEWNVTGWNSLVKLAHHEAEISAMTACAMGNFQCDLAYCKMNYCNSPKFRSRFGNLSWSYPD